MTSLCPVWRLVVLISVVAMTPAVAGDSFPFDTTLMLCGTDAWFQAHPDA